MKAFVALIYLEVQKKLHQHLACGTKSGVESIRSCAFVPNLKKNEIHIYNLSLALMIT